MKLDRAIIPFFQWKLEIIAVDEKVSDIMLTSSMQNITGSGMAQVAANQLMEYQHKQRQAFDFSIAISGTPFFVKVMEALMKVPYGKSVSYEDLAKRIGQPNAQRAVGNAVGKNRLLIVLPCHRIIRKDQSIGGFSAPIELKKRLLNHEQSIK